MKELSIIIVLLLVTIICASIYTNNEQSQKLNNEKSTITVKEQVVEKTYEEILDEDMNLYDIRRIFDEFINLKNSNISYSIRKNIR